MMTGPEQSIAKTQAHATVIWDLPHSAQLTDGSSSHAHEVADGMVFPLYHKGGSICDLCVLLDFNPVSLLLQYKPCQAEQYIASGISSPLEEMLRHNEFFVSVGGVHFLVALGSPSQISVLERPFTCFTPVHHRNKPCAEGRYLLCASETSGAAR